MSRDIKEQKVSQKRYFSFVIFIVTLISLIHPGKCNLYNQDFYLLPNQQMKLISINQNQIPMPPTSQIKQLKVTASIQYLHLNGTYIDNPFYTGNILVKYWKNDINTPVTQVLNYSYDKISATQRFPTNQDINDKGTLDIQALYNYENIHNFAYPFSINSPTTMFVIAVYRHRNQTLTDFFKMSQSSDSIKINIIINPLPPNDLNCSLCVSKTFCASRSCECFSTTYKDCRAKKKYVKAPVQIMKVVNQQNTLKKGSMNYYQIQPQLLYGGYSTVKVKISINFNDNNVFQNSPIDQQKILLIISTQNKLNDYFQIPNIYNYKIIQSNQFKVKVGSQLDPLSSQALFTIQNVATAQGPNLNNLVSVGSAVDSLTITQNLNLYRTDMLLIGIYYLSDLNITTAAQILHQMDVILTNPNSNQNNNTIALNLGLIMGMIAGGLLVLILLIFLLHCVITRKCKFRNVFNSSSSSRRISSILNNYNYLQRNRFYKDKLVLPQISYDFFQQFIFKSTNYLELKRITNQKQRQIQNNSKKLIKKNKFNSHLRQMSKIVEFNNLCSICLQDFSQISKVKYTHCGHLIDSKCLDDWINKDPSCPICRQSFDGNQLYMYQQKIKLQIVSMEPYKTILQEQIQYIKQMYSLWIQKRQVKNTPQKVLRYTEESLMTNNKQLSYINDIGENISTMQELQNSNKKINVNKIISNKSMLSSHVFESKSPNDSNYVSQEQQRIYSVFLNNKNMKLQKIINIFKFYRCIHMYHLKNKKFQKQQPLFFMENQQKTVKSYKENDNVFQDHRQNQFQLQNIKSLQFQVDRDQVNQILSMQNEVDLSNRNQALYKNSLTVENQSQHPNSTQLSNIKINQIKTNNLVIKHNNLFLNERQSNLIKLSQSSRLHKTLDVKHMSMMQQMEQIQRGLQSPQNKKTSNVPYQDEMFIVYLQNVQQRQQQIQNNKILPSLKLSINKNKLLSHQTSSVLKNKQSSPLKDKLPSMITQKKRKARKRKAYQFDMQQQQ